MRKKPLSTALLSLLIASLFVGCGTVNDSPSSSESTDYIEPTIGTDGLTYELADDGSFAICTGVGTATASDVIISSHFEGVLVQEVATSAFSENSSIQSIEIPDGIKTIKQKAFFQCSSLKTVEISSTITEIGAQAFRNCPKLDSVTIEDNNALTKINMHAFADCSALTKFVIGDNSALTTISSYAFNKCKKMTTFDLGENSQLKEIGGFSFQYADGLSKFFIPKSVEIIGSYALGGIGYDEGNGHQSTWVYVEAKTSGILWDGFWNSSNAHVVYERSYEDYLTDRK